MVKITILEPLSISEEKLRELFKNITDDGHELEIYNDIGENDEILKERVKDTDILIIANSPLSKDVINSAKNLKMIAVAFTGVDHVDMDACKNRNIIVSNASGYSNNSVAELVYGMIIALYRNILPLDSITRNGGTKSGYRQRDLKGKTLGVIGTGAIGSEVALIGMAFGMDVIAYNRTISKELIEKGVIFKEFEDTLKESDILTIHLPLTEETKNLISKREFDLMKEDSILINAARGPIINNNDLAKALDEKKIAGAGIDVFDIEPPLKKDYKLLKAKNCIVTPHIGFATEEAMIRRAKITVENVKAFLQGSPINLI